MEQASGPERRTPRNRLLHMLSSLEALFVVLMGLQVQLGSLASPMARDAAVFSAVVLILKGGTIRMPAYKCITR
jgi:hypothetical protein